MERLTEKRGACDHIKGLDINNLQKLSNQSLICGATDKLAAYEYTGATPEQVAEWARAYKEERLVTLPYKPGEKLYFVDFRKRELYRVADAGTEIGVYWDTNEGAGDFFPLSCIGRTVFTSMEDVERAIAEEVERDKAVARATGRDI